MLYVQFRVADQRYAIDATPIVEVLPLVALTPIAQAGAPIAGVMDFRGAPVTVIDLTQLLAGPPAQRRLSTRIVVVDDGRRAGRCIGLIAEHATTIVSRDADEFRPSDLPHLPCLSGIAADAEGLVHRLDISRVLATAGIDGAVVGAEHATA